MMDKSIFPSHRAFQGLAFALGCAASAEPLLHGFLPDAHQSREYLGALGRIVAVFLSVYAVHRFGRTSLRSYRPSWKDMLTLIAITVGSLFILSVGRIIAVSMLAYLGPNHFLGKLSVEGLGYAIPIASGALVLQGVLGLHYGLIFALILALVGGIYSPEVPLFIPYTLAACLVACLSLSRLRSRAVYLRAGFSIAIISIPFALSSALISGHMVMSEMLLRLLCCLVGGVLCSFIAVGVTPIVEYLAGYVTDLRLIEMATLDHPLLKDLSVQAPGTWNHSMVMGMMVESAADAIGANPILARVGSYFHDIGKIKKPLYFVENQAGEENRHDKLSTSMSALIIRSHVKDGIELARKHGLPKPIEDMIPQHHGTSRIEYFYDKACKEAAEAEGVEVDASLYSYPGPKPQTKEAGLLMLADGIEAAARTVTDPSLDRIQGMVQKLINKVFASGELDECELTLKDLHLIAKCFTRVLAGIYHQRIAYAEPAEKTNEREEGELTETMDDSTPDKRQNGDKKSKVESQEEDGKGDVPEDLKRLGL